MKQTLTISNFKLKAVLFSFIILYLFTPLSVYSLDVVSPPDPDDIGDYVWEDTNGDGIQDAGESGIEDVEVKLFQSDGTEIATTSTDASGNYVFSGVAAGDYYLTFNASTADPLYAATLPNEGGDDDLDSDLTGTNGPNSTATFTINAGDDITNMDAGFYLPLTIGDYVWHDADGSGEQNAGEVGIDGVTVTLRNAGGDVQTVTTAGGGAYQFDDVAPGTYHVYFDLASSGYDEITQKDIGGDDTDSDADPGTGETDDFNASSGINITNIDAGMYYFIPEIKGFVWHDRDGDGIQDGVGAPEDEDGVDGMDVQLVYQTGVVVATTTTAGGGFYSFTLADDGTGLKPGQYRVEFDKSTTTFDDYTKVNEGGDDTVDSDVEFIGSSAAWETTDWFITESGSGDTYEHYDAGLWKYTQLGDYCWRDGNQDGIQDDGEYQLEGVEIHLIRESDGADLITVVTGPGGGWGITNVPPDEYHLEFTAPAATFVVTLQDAGVDDEVDSDIDNFGLTDVFNIRSGASEQFWDAGYYVEPPDNCEGNDAILHCTDAELYCDLWDLNEWCTRMPEGNSGGDQPNPLCVGAGGWAHNISWWSFVAGSTEMELLLHVSNCVVDPGMALGVQYGIYTSCEFTETIVCEDLCQPPGDVNITASGLTVGETYYFFLDGCNGTICDYWIEILSGGGSVNIVGPSGIDCDENFPDCTDVCVGAEVNFTLVDVFNGSKYYWTLNGVDYITINPDTTFEFLVAGDYNLCVYAANDCDEGDPVCIDFTVVQLPPEVLDPEDVCENLLEDGYTPEDWLGGPVTEGENTFDAESDLGCLYEQQITITKILNDTVKVSEVGCEGEEIEIEGETYTYDVDDDPIILAGESDEGCDKIVLATTEFISVDGTMEAVCTGLNDGFVRIIFTFDTVHVESMEFTWFHNGDLIDTAKSSEILVYEDGEYEVYVDATYKGVTCTFETFPSQDIYMDDYRPDTPEAYEWDTDACNNVDEYITYQLINTTPDVYQYRWILPDDLEKPIISNSDSTEIQINWLNHSGAVICAYAWDPEDPTCGSSDTICEEIFVSLGPNADFEIPDTVCVNSDVVTSYVGNATSSATFDWTFAGGTETSGSNGEGEGPHHISYDSPGTKFIHLAVQNNGCNSETVTDSVVVVAPPSEPEPFCNPTATSVEFEWDPIDGASSTIVSHLGNGTGTLDGNTYTISGLNPNDEVKMIIKVITDGYCDGFNDTTTCFAKNCDLINVDIATKDTSICLDGSNAPFTLDYNISPNTAGDVRWRTNSGDGIIDSLTGMFDPIKAGVGDHTVVLTFDNGECKYPAKSKIHIYNKPTSEFKVAVDTICITDEAVINYFGSAPSGNATWNFDGGQIVSGSGLGEHKVKWTTSGSKKISLEVDENGCNSDLAEATVFVYDTLKDFNIACSPYKDTIGFSWVKDPNAAAYKVIINGVVVDSADIDHYTVKGVPPGDKVNITVIAIDSGICGDVVKYKECAAKDCPTYKVEITPGIDTICLDDNTAPITFNANVSGGAGNGKVEWIGTGIDKDSGVFDPKVAGEGTHNITMHFTEFCEKDTTITIEVIETPKTELSVDKQIICITDSAVFHFNSDNPPSTNYDWNYAGGTRTNINSSTFSMKWDKPGAYSVSLATNNSICGGESKSAIVIVKPELIPPVIECGERTTNSIEITWNNVDCFGSYNVYVNGELVVNTTDNKYNLTDLEPNSKIDFDVEVVSACECGNVTTSLNCETEPCPNVTVSINDLPEYICISDVNTSFNITADIVGLNTGTVSWEGNGVDNNGVVNTSNLGIGLYEYTLNYNVSKCNYNAKDTMNIIPLPTFTATPSDPLCPTEANGEIQLAADPEIEFYLDGVKSDNGLFTDLAAGTYTVTVKDIHGCESSEEVTLIEPTPINPDISGNPAVHENNPGHFELANVDVSTLQSIVWTLQNGGTVCSGVECKAIDLDLTQDDTLCVTIISNNNCEEHACIGLRYVENVDIDIPNIFTPDGNGVNDVFFITSDETVTQVKEIKIYNRWGEKVFEQANFPTNDKAYGWDGRFKGKKLNPGVYVYYVIFEMKDRKDLKLVGDLTIVH